MADPAGETPSHGRRIAGATAIMMAAILASRLLGLVRNAVISHQLGQKLEADVYYGAFQIPDLMFYLLAGGALSSAFIPVFTEKLTLGKEKEAWHIFSTVACVLFVILAAVIVIGEVFAGPLVHLVNPGFSAEKAAKTIPLTRIVFPAQLCFFMGGLLMGTQYARKQFKIPALGPVIYNLGIILGGLLLAPWVGMAGLCWGVLAGAIVGNFALQLWAVKRDGMQFHISFDWKHPDVMKVWKLMLPVVLGVALPQLSIWINRAFASTLGNGPMAALSNANQMMQVPLGIFAQAMAVAIFPTLSTLAAEKKFTELRSTSSMGIRSLLFLTIPASVFMFILAVPIVQLLLQHGKFHADDTERAAAALAFYCIGIFAWSAQSILSRTFYALQDTIRPVVIGVGVALIFIPMNWLFMRELGMGVRGLALATSVAAALNVFVMLGVLRKRLDGFEIGRLCISVGKTAIAAGAAGAVCWGAAGIAEAALGSMAHHVKLHAAVVLAAGFGAGLVVFVGTAHLLKMEELRQVVSLLRRRTNGQETSVAGEISP